MITCCSNQDLQSTLLERERASAPLDAAAAEHLAACEACQVASERLRRMSSVWMADHVDRCGYRRSRDAIPRQRARAR